MNPSLSHHVFTATPKPEEIVGSILALMGEEDAALRARLETLPVPIYMTDAEGFVTFFNPACIDFAGRTPVAGHDRWCVSWRLFTEDGRPLAHDQCPMAMAIREGREIRGLIAAAERPDGHRVLFLPYPTPIRDADGKVVGAINLLIDVTDRRQAQLLGEQAARCRRLARSVNDSRTVAALVQMADEYEEKARSLKSA